MKYEEIKVGESYGTKSGYTEKVIFKHDETRQLVTIDEDDDITSWHECRIENFKPIKKELPETGLLVLGKRTIVYRTGNLTGFGFNSDGNYDIVTNESNEEDSWTFILAPRSWRTATPEEEDKFIKLLESEADKRVLGVDVKIKGHALAFTGVTFPSLNENYFNPHFTLTEAFNNHGRIFHNGIWAEPLTMLDEVCDVITKHLPNIVVEMTDGVVTLKQL